MAIAGKFSGTISVAPLAAITCSFVTSGAAPHRAKVVNHPVVRVRNRHSENIPE
jgi:hypothetical protein